MDRGHADLQDHLQAGRPRVEERVGQRACLVALRVREPANLVQVVLGGEHPRHDWPDAIPDALPDVQVPGAVQAEQPLEARSRQHVDPIVDDVERDHARGLHAVDDEERAAIVRDAAEGRQIGPEPGRVADGRDGHACACGRRRARATAAGSTRWSAPTGTMRTSTPRSRSASHGNVLFQCSSAGSTMLSPGCPRIARRRDADADAGARHQRVLLRGAAEEAGEQRPQRMPR